LQRAHAVPAEHRKKAVGIEAMCSRPFGEPAPDVVVVRQQILWGKPVMALWADQKNVKWGQGVIGKAIVAFSFFSCADKGFPGVL
jgi:hypothetical protein